MNLSAPQTSLNLNQQPERSTRRINRRGFVSAVSLAMAGGALARNALAEERDWLGGKVVRYPDPDIHILDPRFGRYKIGNAVIERLWTGARWAEGCAWNGGGQYLVWSDIPNDRIMRRLEEDGHVSTCYTPSNNSNGNTLSTLKEGCFPASTTRGVSSDVNITGL